MITLIPCRARPRQDLINLVKSIFPDSLIYLSVDEKADVNGISGHDNLIRHKNSPYPPHASARYFYNEVLRKFVDVLEGSPDEAILLLHDNVVIDDTCKLLINDIYNFVFVSVKKRTFKAINGVVMVDNADRCIAYTKQNFVICHTLANTEKSFYGKTTLDFVCGELDKSNLEYKYNEDVFIKEVDSFWE